MQNKKITREDLIKVDDLSYEVKDFVGRDLTTLNELELFQFCKANKRYREPGISAEELYALHQACELYGHRTAKIVETGMCYGVTTRYFAVRNLRYGGKHVNYELTIRPMFKEDMELIGLWDRIDKRGHSMKDHIEPNEVINILWIDSEHALQDALGEYMRFRVFLNENSIIGFHDTDMCAGVKKALEMIQEVDELELISESSNRLAAGCKIFKRKKASRDDRDWNIRGK